MLSVKDSVELFNIVLRIQSCTSRALNLANQEYNEIYLRAKREDDKRMFKLLDHWDKELRTVYPDSEKLVQEYIMKTLKVEEEK